MITFNQAVFDGYVNGGTTVYTDDTFEALMGTADQLSVSGFTAQVTGTSPTLTVQVEQSFDHVRWQNRNVSPEVNLVTLSTAAETVFQGVDGDPNSRPAIAFVRLRITLGGTAPAGQISIWVTGRDRGSH